jgi:hypothetical protein
LRRASQLIAGVMRRDQRKVKKSYERHHER